MDILVKEAKAKEKKEKRSGKENVIWGSVVGIVDICRRGMRKEARDRISARELEQEIRECVDKALGPDTRNCCGTEPEPRGSWASRTEIYDSYAVDASKANNTSSEDGEDEEPRQNRAYLPIQGKQTSGMSSPEENFRHQGRVQSGVASFAENWPLPTQLRRDDGIVSQTAGMNIGQRGNLVM